MTADPAIALYNARILPMTDAAPATALVAGSDGRILAMGDDRTVLDRAGHLARRADLGGRTLIPGFFDCHMHLLWLGLDLGNVDVSPERASTPEALMRLLREHLRAHPHVTYLAANRYDQNRLRPAQHITRRELDQVSTTLPIHVRHVSGHAAVVNTEALRRLGYTSSTENPPGGAIERDAAGEPTGVLLETASWTGLDKIMPEPSQEECGQALARASSYLLERGVTSASDANTPVGDIAAYARAAGSGNLGVRVNLMLDWVEVMDRGSVAPSPDELQAPQAVARHMVHVGQAKLFADGAITTRTCWLTEGFAGAQENYGIPLHTQEELEHLILQAHIAGWQIATHGIGDRAIDAILTAYAKAQQARPRARPDHRVEHCMLLTEGLIARLRRQHVWSIGQPEFLSRLGDAYVAALGQERADRLSPYRLLEERGVAQAFSSDCPVVPGSPLDGLRAAMERKTSSGRAIGADQAVSAESALYFYTAAPAYACRAHKDRGTLEVGKFADLVVLNRDPLETPLEEWQSLRVEATLVGGKLAYGELG